MHSVIGDNCEEISSIELRDLLGDWMVFYVIKTVDPDQAKRTHSANEGLSVDGGSIIIAMERSRRKTDREWWWGG